MSGPYEKDLNHFCELRQRACPVRVEIAEIWKELEGNQIAMNLAAKTLDARLESMNEVWSQLRR